MNQLAMMESATKLGEMNRSIDTQNKLRDLYSQGVDVTTPEGFKQHAAIDPMGAMKLRSQAFEGRKLQAETGLKEFELDKNKIDKAITDISNHPTAQDAYADIQKRVQAGELPADKANFIVQQLKSMPYEKFQMTQIKNLLGAKDRLTLEEQAKHNRSLEGASWANVDVARQTLANANNPEVQAKLAAAKAGGTETGKSTAQAAIALPSAVATGEEAIRKIDALVGALPVKNAEGKIVQAGTKPHAGFGQSVGFGIPGLKYIPGTSAADFNARLNEVQGGAFLQAFNTLKGGGSITETEGTKATQAINRMSTAQSEKEFNTAAREYQDVIRTGIARAKAKAANAGDGGVPVGRGGSAPAAGGEIDFNSLK